ALADVSLERIQGWLKKERRHDASRCVCVVTEDGFVVVLRFGISQHGVLKANFVTCYVADNSLTKILEGPAWDVAECVATLQNRPERRRA
ncbi:hypothetical protein O5Y58_17415, partial [Microbacterium paraoxydans]|uniref:hypothetical protein n=1 Tax=Microbacterium paraoxydans TaxID=199592 RepID=UPI00352C8ACD